MSKPAVGGSSVPMLHTCRDVDDRSRKNLLRRLSLLLIPATTSHTDKHLTSAFGGMMDVPVIATSWFKGDVGNGNLFIGNTCQVTVASKILGVGSIGFTDGENH